MRPREIKHFSHPHRLLLSEAKKEDQIHCLCCEQGLSGPAYTCSDANCKFFLHKSCFQLPRTIQHEAHPGHRLTLLAKSAYESGEYGCNACGENGEAFVFDCLTCQVDLHVKCANLPVKMKRDDHQHPLTLYYSSKYEQEDNVMVCSICDEAVPQSCWVYYCVDCDYGTHLFCANASQHTEDGSVQVGVRNESVEFQSLVDELARIQFETQLMNYLNAQAMVNLFRMN